jgi:hypothetical protein
MTVTLDGRETVLTPEAGSIFIPRRTVHSFRGFHGEKTVFEERNQPAGIYKALSVSLCSHQHCQPLSLINLVTLN